MERQTHVHELGPWEVVAIRKYLGKNVGYI